MSRTDPHPVRNAVIATVVGGVILAALGLAWEPTRRLLGTVWMHAVSLARLVGADYLVPGWLLLVMALGSLAAVVYIALILVRRFQESREPSYTQDIIHGGSWHWSWSDGRITNLSCLCPACSAELVYLHDPDSGLLSVPRARYFCENCRSVVVEIEGGGRDYAISAIEREIRRRYRVSQQSAARKAS